MNEREIANLYDKLLAKIMECEPLAAELYTLTTGKAAQGMLDVGKELGALKMRMLVVDIFNVMAGKSYFSGNSELPDMVDYLKQRESK